MANQHLHRAFGSESQLNARPSKENYFRKNYTGVIDIMYTDAE